MSLQVAVDGGGMSCRIYAALEIIGSGWRITTQYSKQGYIPGLGPTAEWRTYTEREHELHNAALRYLTRNFISLTQLGDNQEDMADDEIAGLRMSDFVYAACAIIERCRQATTRIDMGGDTETPYDDDKLPPTFEPRNLTAEEAGCYDAAQVFITAMFDHQTENEQLFVKQVTDAT